MHTYVVAGIVYCRRQTVKAVSHRPACRVTSPVWQQLNDCCHNVYNGGMLLWQHELSQSAGECWSIQSVYDACRRYSVDCLLRKQCMYRLLTLQPCLRQNLVSSFCLSHTYTAVYSYTSVLWRCWLGGRKGIRPVKNWVVGYWHGYLSGVRCRLAYGPADATATHCLLLQ